MQKRGKNHSNIHSYDRQEIRLTTAPVRQRHKYSDFSKTNYVQLPLLRGKKISQNQQKKVNFVRKEDIMKTQVEVEEISKRPQTSKGSRKTTNADTQYYQQQDDDLMIINNHNPIIFPNGKVDFFKKSNNQSTSKQLDQQYTKL